MNRLIATYGIVGTFVVTGSGCDPARQGSQDIGIVLERAESSEPVQEALLRCAPQDRRGPRVLYDLSQTEYLARHSRKPVRTNEFGKAVLTVDTGNTGTELLDQVTWEYYLIEIQHGDSE